MYRNITDKKEICKYIIGPEEKIVDAMRKINGVRGRDLLIIDENECLIGAVSDGNIRRSIMANGDLEVSVKSIMNTTPKYIFAYDDVERVFPNLSVKTVPVVDEGLNITSLWVERDTPETVTVEQKRILAGVSVVVMAGGKGTRLYPFTKILPKPLIPIGDVPIVERIINRYTKYGLNRFYLTVNYKKGMIKSYFDELMPDYEVVYVEEDKPLGTAGSLKLINRKFDKPIFVANCDILIDADYADIYRHHLETESAITIVAAMKQVNIPYGVINAGQDSIIQSMEEKPSLSHLVNTGMYVVNPEYLDEIPDDRMFHMPELAEKLMEKGLKVSMYPISEEAFLDMGELEEMKRMEEKLNV